jgi:glucan-binding YG repeat protein
MTATINRLKADIMAEKDKRAKDVRTERQQKAEANAKAEELETKLSGVRGEVERTFESRLEKLEKMWSASKHALAAEREERVKAEEASKHALAAEREERVKAEEASKHALAAEREERERALKEQGVAHAKREDELAQKLKDLSEALTCAVLRNVSHCLIPCYVARASSLGYIPSELHSSAHSTDPGGT